MTIFCNEMYLSNSKTIDIDEFYKDIKENSSMFIAGLGDGIGSNRDRKRININIEVKA